MLIALCIVAPLLAISLAANLLQFADRRHSRRLADECIDSLRRDVRSLAEKVEGLEDDLAFAESLIDEWEADYDGLSGGVLDAMDDLAGARDALNCALAALADLAGAMDDDDECGCPCCCEED